jgi:putative oxidoreductase
MNALALPWLTPYRKYGLVLLRIGLGALFVVYGWNKVSDISGFQGMLDGMGMGFMAWPVALIELLGGIALILGVFTRIAGLLLAAVMLVAIVQVHLANGFAGDGGWGFRFVFMMAALALALMGGGKMGLDDMMGWDTD